MVSSIQAQAEPQKRRGNDPISWYLQNIGRVPLLTPAEEIELGNQVQKMMILTVAKKFIEKNKEFNPPIECKFKLSGNQVRQKMQKKLDELYNNKKILDHGMVVGKELAYVLSGGDTEKNKEISEDQMYNLELNSFMKLLETQNTQNRIAHTLKTGKPLIN